MKKVMSIIAAALAATTLSTAAFAASAGRYNQNIDSRVAKLTSQQQKIEQKEQTVSSRLAADSAKSAEYQQLMQDREQVLENRESNLKILDENKTLRLEIAAAIKAVKQSGQTLPADTLTALKTDNQQISSIWAEIGTTKGQIKAIEQQNKTAVKNKDYTTIDANFQKIYTIQQQRNQYLTQINSILQQMEALLTSNAAA